VDRLAVMEELQGFAVIDGVSGCRGADLNPQRSPGQVQPERESGQGGRQSRCEAERGVGVRIPP
jgi:hypothetical protein